MNITTLLLRDNNLFLIKACVCVRARVHVTSQYQ